ncbi:MAG: prepilin peptidase [Lentisphaerae bacterium]|jgi:leader peptidase (prepilin peptidase)/N-methyltransferase|nr:prepilin peptidase [Victivallaceae bacterium]MDD3704362.1 prepilin peptidase [Victivallaceae bacterium]MDD5663818.1 prepilin peptidase [Victivallaceae bacterium]NLK82853.1 prepilin peptidase [Lentisphaerota bacterium]
MYDYPFSSELMPLWYFFVFIFGCCIGSFLNVCIWRIPRGESIVTAPSHCPKCNHEIHWYENIPLVSWLALRGRCSECKNPITIRYFLVELITGILYLAIFYKVISNAQPLILLPVCFALIMLTICTAVIDFEHMIIPDKITYPAMVFGLINAAFFPELWGTSKHFTALLFSLGSMFGCTLIMSIFSIAGEKIFKQEALGWGDVKYMAAISACLGPTAAFFVLLIGSVAGAVIGSGLLLFSKRIDHGHGHATIPFGPFLALATVLWLFIGERFSGMFFR